LLKGLLAWLFSLGTEPRCMHWCLLVGDVTCSFRLHDIEQKPRRTFFINRMQWHISLYFQSGNVAVC